MRISIRRAVLLVPVFCLVMLSIQSARAAEDNTLRVGVAKVDITPANLTHLNPMGYGTQTDVHDPIFARVLIIDNGHDSVAIVSLDLIETGDTLEVRGRIEKELGIPVNHIVITTSHAHSAPRLGKPAPGSLDKLGSPEFDAYTDVVNNKIVAALKQAKASMQPARLGLGAGSVDVNVNREQYTPQGWKEGYNPTGPSDKTVWVLKFETTSGTPIAVLFNYAVHSVVTMRENRLGGDLAGAAEDYVERHFGDNVVALWTLGSAGDQVPRLTGSQSRPAPAGSAPAPVKGQSPSSYDAMTAQGLMIGAEVVRVANQVQLNISSAKIGADERVISCPLREGIDKLSTFHPTPTGSVPIRLGVIVIGDIAFATVSGEVATTIYWRLRKASPLTNTILVTLTNDRTGYFVDDAAYATSNFEVLASPAARGCAEDGIVNGLVDMINKYR